MPILIKNIEGTMEQINTANITIPPIIGKIGIEDYIKVGGFIAYLQNLRYVISVTELLIPNKNVYNSPDSGIHPTPSVFGLINNLARTNLNISYYNSKFANIVNNEDVGYYKPIHSINNK
jgi:hypothetical protein